MQQSEEGTLALTVPDEDGNRYFVEDIYESQ